MILDTTIDRLIHCKTYHQRYPEYGERAWRAKGENLEVIYWDVGNGCCSITQVLPRNMIFNEEFMLESLKFFRKLEKVNDQ